MQALMIAVAAINTNAAVAPHMNPAMQRNAKDCASLIACRKNVTAQTAIEMTLRTELVSTIHFTSFLVRVPSRRLRS